MEKSVFPYQLREIRTGYDGHSLLPFTPFGNTLITDFALEIIDREELGQDDHVDMLAVSYSSTDYIGHVFGPHSIEVQDTYLRLDLEIARILEHCDRVIGKDNYLVFVTADHGAVTVPGLLRDAKMNGVNLAGDELKNRLDQQVREDLGTSELIEFAINNNIYLNREWAEQNGFDLWEVRNKIKQFLIKSNIATHALTYDEMISNTYTTGIHRLLQEGFHPHRSGDIIFNMNPGVLLGRSYLNGGTSHGTGYTYDTHVPMLWYGSGVRKGFTVRKYEITDIVPTLAMKLGIPLTDAATGKPIEELF
jgi:arylsulfatase A-like enzyme